MSHRNPNWATASSFWAPRGTLPVEVEESLKQALGSEVNVAYHDGKGKLTVHFYSDEQLKAFANLLGQYQVED